MSENDRPDISPLADPSASIAVADPGSLLPPAPSLPRIRPRLKKLRLALVLVVLGLLALVSAVFGMIMAVASDLPALENAAEFKVARNSILTDDQGRQIGILTGDKNRVLVASSEIPAVMKRAMIAIEDKRFYTESGIDFRGMARALIADVTHGRPVQGASTIAQQFVKNQLAAQNHRTIFQKLREAALAFHLTRKWSKDKILTEYLNTIYFGNGAYGIESAARTYFGSDPNHAGCGTPRRLCVTELKPWEAALLAGMVASPSGYDPTTEPQAAFARRNLVLADMYHQGYLTRDEYQTSIQQTLPPKPQIQPPQVKALDPSIAYFTTWVQQQVVQRFGATQAFDGGLKIRTTLDLDLQSKAQTAINNYLAYTGGPTAALVAIDNATGAVRAMVGGRDYYKTPFNLATQGQRQPGSAFKLFVLAQALREGISPNSIWPSEVRTFIVPGTHGREHFVVHNDNNAYAGTRSLTDATTYSDNSVFAAVGIQAGISRIAALAQRMGIRTPVSQNPAITIGGLRQGVTVLDMAHAYETIAHGGQAVTGTLGAGNNGPVGIQSVQFPGRSQPEVNATRLRRVLSPSVTSTETAMLENVVSQGTGKAAAIGGFEAGKTGTTENYGDAWFVGFTKKLTVAVWVGYPDSTKSMKYDFAGSPVLGGTYPAEIWHDFMTNAQQLYADRAAAAAAKSGSKSSGSTSTSTSTNTSSTPAPAPSSGSTTSSGSHSGGSGGAAPKTQTTPSQSAPAPATGGGNVKTNAAPVGGGGGNGGGGGSPPPAAATPAPQQSTPSPGTSGGSSAPTGGASPTG
jgi:penicillin-binding protein 1A